MDTKTGPQGHPAERKRLRPLTLEHAPALYAAVSFAMGVGADRLLVWRAQTSALRCVAAVLAILVAAVALKWAPRLRVVTVLFVWMLLGWLAASTAQRPPLHASIELYADGLSRKVQGVVRDVRALQALTRTDSDTDGFGNEDGTESGEPALTMLDIAVRKAEEVTPDTSAMRPADGVARVYVRASTAGLRCGDVIEIPARLHKPDSFRDPGVWERAAWLHEKGVRVQGTSRATTVTVTGHERASLQCSLAMLQRGASERLRVALTSRRAADIPAPLRLTPEETGLVSAMLVGDRTGVSPDDRLAFERTGTFHLVVVAGLHVGFLAAVCVWLLERMRLHRVLVSLVSLLIVGSYSALTGFGQPVQRALMMTALFLFARAFHRRGDSMNALGFAAVAMLWYTPSSLFEASFQMTVLAVFAIAGIAIPLGEHTVRPHEQAMKRIEVLRLDQHIHPKLAELRVCVRLIAQAITFEHRERAARWLSWVIRGCLAMVLAMLVALVSEVIMTLPMLVYFHRLVPAALPANLFTLPLIAPLVVLASLMMIAAMWSSSAAAVVAMPVALILHLLRHMVRWIAGQSFGDVRAPAPTAMQIVLAISACAVVVYLVRRKDGRFALAGVALLAVTTALLVVSPHPVIAHGTLEMTALDVGQGDSLFLASPEGQLMLVDAGGPTGRASAELAKSVSGYDIGEEVVAPYLWQRKVRRLDVLVLTHAHSDHIGGMMAVLRDFRPRELWLSATPKSDALSSLLAAAYAMKTRVRVMKPGDVVSWGGTRIDVLGPAVTSAGEQPRNNDSLVMRVKWQRASALLEGDAEAESEQDMLRSAGLEAVTVLKVAHHGSRTSTTQALVDAVKPQVAVISDGRNNTFGHPRHEVIDRLAAQRTRVYRTDMHGATTVLLYPDGRSEVSTWNVR